MNDKISVIIPVYNTEQYLLRCFDSVKNQNYPNIEIIFIDDGSSDNSRKICESIINENCNAKLISHEKNKGQEATRNDGIKAATGDWIFFLDSDDTIEKESLAKLVEIGNDTGADIVWFNFQYIHDNVINVTKPKIVEGLYSKNQIVSMLLEEIPWSVTSCIGSKMYRSSLITDNNLKYDITYKYNEDGAFAIEAINHSKKIYYKDLTVYNYIIRHENSVQSSYRKNIFDTVKNVHIYLYRMFVENSCIDKNINNLYFHQVQLIYVSLKNEIDYRSYREYIESYKSIINDSFYINACKGFKLNKSFGKWIFAKLFVLRFDWLLYLIIKYTR